MSLADRLFKSESRAIAVSGTHPRDPVLAEMLGGGGNTSSGVNVTPTSAMQLSAVYACLRILSSSSACLPLELYRRMSPAGREKATELSLYRKLHTQPNKIQSSFEWREQKALHLLLRGNAYNFKQYNNSGEIENIIPFMPDRVRVFRAPDNSLGYEHTDDWGQPHIYLQDEIMHFRGMSLDGITGLDPIQYHKETFGLSLAADEFGGRYFGNGTVVDGVLQMDEGSLSEPAYERLKKDWKDRRQGLSNAHKPLILEEGLKWNALTVEPEKAQFLETRGYQRTDIAMIFGVPPHMIGDTAKVTSFGSGIESQSIGFLVYSLMPWLVRSEQTMNRDLLDEARYRNLYTKHNVSALLRGDSKSRGEFYKTLFNLSAINANEIREYEEMNPYDGGDTYYAPLNMGDATKLSELVSDEEPLKSDTPNERFHYRMVSQVSERIVSCESRAIERIVKCASGASDLEKKIYEFSASHGDFLQRHLQPVAGNMESIITNSLMESFKKQMDIDLGSENPKLALQQRANKWRAGRAETISRSISLAALDGLKGEL